MAETTLLIGTTKGLFLATLEGATWELQGPHCDGWAINHAIGDADGRLWAGGGGTWTGAGVWRSKDRGATWALAQFTHGAKESWVRANEEEAAGYGLTPQGPAPFDDVAAVWSLRFVGGTLYAGTKPARLYASEDGGALWSEVRGLSEHPSAATWQGGNVGLTLHTILDDPEDSAKIWVGISAAGVFATEDGGATWARRNRLSNQGDGSETGLCVHNMMRAGGDLLYQQNHEGVFRSRDGGRSWDDISHGLPSRFGFPIAVHPADPDTVWAVPLEEMGRVPVGASAAVWRSSDGGESWTAMRAGLPEKECYFTVLRQAMAVDPAAGIYFGTNSGSVFASEDAGETWIEIVRHLPTILSVETC